MLGFLLAMLTLQALSLEQDSTQILSGTVLHESRIYF
jgi:hypothetical protein